jgi:hypothetical protein
MIIEASPTKVNSYQLMRQAIVDRASLTGLYDRYVRFFSPRVLGIDLTGKPVVIAISMAAAGAAACRRAATGCASTSVSSTRSTATATPG